MLKCVNWPKWDLFALLCAEEGFRECSPPRNGLVRARPQVSPHRSGHGQLSGVRTGVLANIGVGPETLLHFLQLECWHTCDFPYFSNSN